MDVAARITALLDQAQADGSQVIAIEAIRRVLGHEPQARPRFELPTIDIDVRTPEPTAARNGHVLVVGQGRWVIRHPVACDGPCSFGDAANKRFQKNLWAEGEYEVWVVDGLLRGISTLVVSTT